MNQQTQFDRVRLAVLRVAQDGCPVAGDAETTAQIAMRRWNSYGNRGLKQDDLNGRTRDLAKGLASHFEADPSLVGPLLQDYEYLASKLVEVLAEK